MKVILNTKDRQLHTSTSNPMWILSEPIHNYTSLKLSKCIIPNVLYSFDENNNKITINGITGNIPTNKRYKLMSSCIADLNSSVPVIPNVSSFVFSFLEEQGILRITYTSTVNIQIKKNVRLGLPADANLQAGSNLTYDFPNLFSLQNTNVIYACINSFNTDDTRSSLGFTTILGSIPVSGIFGDVSVYMNDDESSYVEIQGADTISTIHMTFRDAYGNIINLRGQDITIELLLKK